MTGSVGESRAHRRSLKLGVVTCAVLAATLGGSATALAARTPKAAQVTNITWWNMWSGATAQGLDTLVTAFNATHPSIHVTQLNVPSADGNAKLLSAIAAGSPPDLFTEFDPTIGQYAQDGLLQPMTKFITGADANLLKSLYPGVVDGGVYKGQVYGLSMGEGALGLFYNKRMLKSAGIAQPPKTLAQLDADQAKEWKISDGRVTQIGFYPSAAVNRYFSYFGVDNAGYVSGKYDLARDPHAVRLAKWLSSFSKYPYSAVTSFNSAYGSVAGGSEDPFALGHAGFDMVGVWEVADSIATNDPAMLHNFGVVPFPKVPGGPSGANSFVWGNYNIIPKGAKNAAAAFQFAVWLSGYTNANYIDKNWIVPQGQMPVSKREASAPIFTSWLRSNPWARVFVSAETSPASETLTLTPGEAEYSTALADATQYLETSKMSPTAALAYADSAGNAALTKSGT